MLSDEWLPRYRLLKNFTMKWNGNGNGNAYDRGDYNSSFALRAVELKTTGLAQEEQLHVEFDVITKIRYYHFGKCLLQFQVLNTPLYRMYS